MGVPLSTPAGYDPSAYEPVAVTVDIVALTIRDGELNVLLVERGEEPFLKRLALPGGFVRTSRNARGGIRGETPDEAAARELAEETGLVPGSPRLRRVHLEQLATFGAPRRDPRMRVFSVAYLAFAADLPDPSPVVTPPPRAGFRSTRCDGSRSTTTRSWPTAWNEPEQSSSTRRWRRLRRA